MRRVICFRRLDVRPGGLKILGACQRNQNLCAVLVSERIMALPEMICTNLNEMDCKANARWSEEMILREELDKIILTEDRKLETTANVSQSLAI